MRHWEGILKNKAIVARTIVYKEKVAGHILCWKEKYEHRVGYWVGKPFWGRGIASAALAEFLRDVKIRPLFAGWRNTTLHPGACWRNAGLNCWMKMGKYQYIRFRIYEPRSPPNPLRKSLNSCFLR